MNNFRIHIFCDQLGYNLEYNVVMITPVVPNIGDNITVQHNGNAVCLIVEKRGFFTSDLQTNLDSGKFIQTDMYTIFCSPFKKG